MRAATAPTLHIGLIVDGLLVPAWMRRMLERITSLDYVSIALVVIGSLPLAARTGPQRTLPALTRAALERRAIDSANVANDAFALVDVQDLLADAPRLAFAPHGGGADLYSAVEVEEIERFGLDVLIHLGSRPLAGDVLDVARCGVWTHRTGDAPEGLSEAAEGRTEIRSALEALTPAGTKTLYESWSSTDPTCVATSRNRAYWKAASFAPRVLADLHRVGAEAFRQRVGRAPVREPAPPRPGSWKLARFLARRFVERRRVELLEKLYREQWLLLFGFGFAFGEGDGPPADCLNLRKLVPPRDRFWADPQVLARDGQYYIFLEEYLYATHRAHISLLVMDADGRCEPPVPIIGRPYHLSYPHVFEWRGALYMVPETKANATIEVYRCRQFPYAWELETYLMKNVDAVDTTLLEHNGRWWLFANMVENPGASSWDELFLFFADSPLSERWTPHPQNPIVSDVRRSRPAGRIFASEGRLYRPSQDSSQRYGYGLNINEITELTESRYSERLVRRVEPKWDRSILATHTFAFDRGLTVIDGMRRCRRWP